MKHLFLGCHKLSDIGVVTLLCVLVSALQDGILLQGLDFLLLHETTQARVWVCGATTEIHPFRRGE